MGLRSIGPPHRNKGEHMLTAVIITFILVASLGYALRSGRSGSLIARRPYNNRYSDASGSREDHLT
jgi:hypothetical protein